MAESGNNLQEIVAALKVAVATLRRAEIPFLLAGSSAAWARGAPPPHKDLDLMLAPEDAEQACRRWETPACGPSARRRSGSTRPGAGMC
ncbi:MAG: hypothetical protein M3Z27_07200 [Actinomycetota bacterium]|nr:hypothetical protein [Actinomycetota bacterium]